MRDAGVEYVVFPSTFSITPDTDIRSIPKEEYIPFAHGQIELAAEEIGFPHFMALRPGQFASNHFKNFLDRSSKPPKASFVYGDAVVDNIAPEDIGEVSGAVLVERPSDGTTVIYQCGPELITMAQSWELIKKISGRDDIDTAPTPREQQVQALIAKGLPPVGAAYLVETQEASMDRQKIYVESMYDPAVENTKKYTGREATKFTDYLEAHKTEWQAL